MICSIAFRPTDALLWGVQGLHSKVALGYEEMIAHAAETARREEFAKPGNSIVVVFGIPFGKAGTTNNPRVVQVSGN